MTRDQDGPRPGGARASLAGAVGGVAGLTLASRVLGFVRWVVQATTVGAGTVAGAYATANQVPNVLYEVVVGGALAATVVPLLASSVGGARPEHSSRTASGLLGVVLVVLVPLAALLALGAGHIASLLPVSVGTDPQLQRQLVAAFLRMFALQVPLYGVGVVLSGVLQAHGSFTWPALSPVLSSLVVMATYALYAHLEAVGSTSAVLVLGWGTTAGVAALSLPLLLPVRRLGIRIRPCLRLPAQDRRRALGLAGAGAWTLLAQQASVLAVLALARAGGAVGTVAVYQYTQAVYMLPYAVLAAPISTVLYPRVSAAFAAVPTSPEAERQAAALAARSTALVAVVATAGAGVLVASSHGAESFFGLLTQVHGMGWALVALAPALLGLSLVHHVTRVLYAAERCRQAALATSLGWVVVTAASVVAVRLLAPEGGRGAQTLLALSLGLSLGLVVGACALLVLLARRSGTQVLVGTARALAVSAPVAALCGGLGRWASQQASSAPGAVAVAVGAALVAGAAVVAAAWLADRRLLSVIGRPGRLAPQVTVAGKVNEDKERL